MLNSAVIEKKQTRPAGKTKVKKVAYVSDSCTGCGGVPVCRVYCKFDALQLVDDEDNYPFKKVMVDSGRCVGCGACVSSGVQGLMLTGCPWNAIRLIPVLQ